MVKYLFKLLFKIFKKGLNSGILSWIRPFVVVVVVECHHCTGLWVEILSTKHPHSIIVKSSNKQ